MTSFFGEIFSSRRVISNLLDFEEENLYATIKGEKDIIL